VNRCWREEFRTQCARDGVLFRAGDAQKDRDRGESRDSSPPTPPDVRVRIRRFGGLSRPRHRDGSQAKGPQGASG
jgi:hypothetical protein